MKLLKQYIFAFALCCSTVVAAQQLPQFTQYMYNTIAINPAYAGSREALSVIGLHRSQWVGFDGGPVTQTLSVHSPLRDDRIGLGLTFIEDDLGPENFTYLYGDFSYTIPTGRTGKLAFGIKGGFTSYSLDDDFRTSESFDPQIRGIANRWTPNIGLGLYYHTNRFYAGASAPRVLNTNRNTEEGFEALERLSYYGIMGAVFDLSHKFKFKPSTLLKVTNGAPASLDLTANFLYDEKVWLGGSYRINESAAAIGGFLDLQVSRQLRIGYSYEKPTSEIRAFTSGTHEVLLIYEFKFISSKLKSPRYF